MPLMVVARPKVAWLEITTTEVKVDGECMPVPSDKMNKRGRAAGVLCCASETGRTATRAFILRILSSRGLRGA